MAEKKLDPSEELSQKIEQCLTVQEIHKKLTLANDYRKRFECKNSSKWFHSNKALFDKGRRRYCCCDMGQNDTIGKIELKPSFVLSSDNTNYKNDIQ